MDKYLFFVNEYSFLHYMHACLKIDIVCKCGTECNIKITNQHAVIQIVYIDPYIYRTQVASWEAVYACTPYI